MPLDKLIKHHRLHQMVADIGFSLKGEGVLFIANTLNLSLVTLT
jgi:hypothetical protein